jgi:hypothetical protein
MKEAIDELTNLADSSGRGRSGWLFRLQLCPRPGELLARLAGAAPLRSPSSHSLRCMVRGHMKEAETAPRQR